MKELAKIDSRNYGIDLLRIVSMFFIVLLHSFGHGGLLNGLDTNSTQYKAVYFFEISAYCAVDIFGIISGYVSYNPQGKKVKFSNLLKLWTEVVFLCILYIIGLIMKKCELGKNLKSRYGIIAILILTLISYIYVFKGHEINILGNTITNRVFESYISPTVLGIAIFYVIIFSKMKIGNIIKKTIKFSAPSAFAIYIINEHPIIRKNIITGMFTSSCNQKTLIILAKVFLFAIVFVVAVILIDKIRQLIFEKCKINYLCDKIVKKIENI